MSMARALGKDGPGTQVVWRGKKITLHPMALCDEAEFEEWLKVPARAELAESIKGLAPDIAAAAVAKFAAEAPKKYKFPGPIATAALATMDGLIMAVRTMVKEAHPDLYKDPALVREMVLEIGVPISLAVADFFRRNPMLQTSPD